MAAINVMIQNSELIHFFTGTFVSIVSMVDPLMAIPVFITLTGDETTERRNEIAREASMNVFGILTLFFLAGTLILNIFGISINALKIAGGLMILMTASSMLEKKERLLSEEKEEARSREDIAFSPLAMPLLSGPGAIAVIIGLTVEAKDIAHYLIIFLVMVIVCYLCYLCMKLAEPITKKLGNTLLKAFSRIINSSE